VERGGEIVIRLVAPPEYTLDELVAEINDENRYGETDTGAPVGWEVL
jgi:antitoxin component of MazEF toxin-antitoxin module